MKYKFFLSQVVLYILLCPLLNAQNNSFRFVDPKAQWRQGPGLITYAEYIVRIDQNFAHCDLYLTYTANISGYTNPKDTFEVVQYFNLPKQILVTDSWLWVDTVIMKADILERRSAFNIYEGIVNRRQDPSILFKNSETQYEYRIFPIVNKKSRRVKLSFIMPLNRVKDKVSFALPTSLIAASGIRPNIVLKVKYDESYQKLSNSFSFTEAYDNFLGKHFKTDISPSSYGTSSEISLSFQMDDNHISFATEKSPENELKSNYQISINPASAFGLNQEEARNVVILIDNETVMNSLTKQQVINNVKEFANTSLYAIDSLQIIYTNNKSNKLFNEFIPYNAAKLNESLNGVALGDISLLYNSIFESYELLKNRTNPVLIVFSSGISFANSSVAASAKNYLYSSFKTIPKSFFINLNNSTSPGFWYQNQYYIGNNLFYNTMASNSGGSFVSLVGNINNFSNITGAIQKLSEDIEDRSFNDFEIEIRIKSSDGGFSYDNTIFKKSRTGFMQSGLLVGKAPFTIEGVFYNSKDIITKNITLTENEIQDGYNNATQIHAGLTIQKFETDALKTKESQILELSLKNRVLSRYTAFLALEPNLQTPCYTCEDESNTPTSVYQTQFGHKIKIFPNPFSNIINIEILDVNDEKVEELGLYDIMGRKVEVEYEVKYEGDDISILVQGSDLKPGIYFIKVKLGNKMMTFKVIRSA